MNEKFKELYSYLKSNNMTDLDEANFYKKYSDPSKSKEIYSYLKSKKMTDLDANAFHNSYFGGSLKKKEPTVSPSQSVQEPSSLAAPPKKKQPLSGSTIKREGDIFTGYPGKADKKYRLDTSGTSPVWMEYSSSKVVNGKTVDEFNKPITNPNRVNALNKYFKAGASTSTQEKIFTGFPGKEKNEYLY